MHGGEEKCIQGFGGETEGKRPYERPRYRWEDNMKIDLKKEAGMAWNGCVWHRVVTDGRLL
jgi:hypothetical protein